MTEALKMCTHKMYGVDMNDVKKLREFQLSLMKRKFGKEFDKIEFMAHVQVRSEAVQNPEIIQIIVANSSIHIDYIVIPKCVIIKMETNNNQVIVRFKRPLFGLGSYMSLNFADSVKTQDFVNSVGEIEIFESDGSDEADTPPRSDDSN